MVTMQLMFGVLLLVIPASAMYFESPTPCYIGEACSRTFSRSYVNNYVFCCPNGQGSSVSSFNNVVSCQCGSGTYFSDTSSAIFLNGRQLNATEAQPYIQAMQQAHQQNMQQFQNNMQQFRWNMQNMQNNLQQSMAALQARLNNMASRFRFW